MPVPLINAYKMVRPLGTGGMGAVYLAEENNTRRLVAIKIISKQLAEDSRARNRFLREGRAMATVQHPHVVQFYSVGEFSGQPYLVMQYVDGETLSERIKREGQLPIQDALRVLRQTVEALAAAWEKSIVHRDMKPSNILLDRNGEAHVADFGLAKTFQVETDSTLTQSGAIIGSPHYISPEQAQGKSVDFRSDIYALGIVLYEMLVGGRPFEDTTPLAIVLKHLNTPLPSAKEKRQDLPESVVRLLQWMTQKEPEKRPSSYHDLLVRIDSLLNVKQPKKKVRIVTPALVVLVVALGVGSWFLQHRQKAAPAAKVLPQPEAVLALPKPVTGVTINAIPWARFKLIPKGFAIPAISEKEQITPSNLSLPAGEYVLELSNITVSKPIQHTIHVRAGATNSFFFAMPKYDPKKSLALVRGRQ